MQNSVKTILLTFGSILCCLSLLASPLMAQGDVAQKAAQEEIDIVYLQTMIIPGIEKIIQSLQAQNAPIPQDLKDLLKTGKEVNTRDALTKFETQASHYFGSTWKEDLITDTTLTVENAQIIIRMRIYLSSLIANAERIALSSPMDAEEIRTQGTALLTTLHNAEDAHDRAALFTAFAKTYEAIFPEGRKGDLSDFRQEVTLLLAEIDDAITILVDGRTVQKLRTDLSLLQSHLQLVADSQQLTAWLARFDSFTNTLLKHTIPTETSLLVRDFSALLKNLQEYLRTLEIQNIATGTLSERVVALQKNLADISTDKELDVFLKNLENVLTRIENANTSSPSTTSE